MIQFVIPSYQRVGAVSALDMFPTDYEPHIVVREHEEKAYYDAYGSRAKIITIPDDVNGIAGTRKAITDMYAGQRIWMIDDDTTIRMSSMRKKDDRRCVDKINQLTREQFYELIQYVEDAMDCGYYHGHARLPIFKITSSWGNYRENSYGFTNTWYDLEKLTTEQIGYGKIDLCEDMYAFLNLINQGYPHLALFKYLVVSGKAQAPGGCSSIRSNSKHNRALEQINKEFPEQARWKTSNIEKRKSLGEEDEPLKVLRMCVSRKEKSEAFHKFNAIHPIAVD